MQFFSSSLPHACTYLYQGADLLVLHNSKGAAVFFIPDFSVLPNDHHTELAFTYCTFLLRGSVSSLAGFCSNQPVNIVFSQVVVTEIT